MLVLPGAGLPRGPAAAATSATTRDWARPQPKAAHAGHVPAGPHGAGSCLLCRAAAPGLSGGPYTLPTSRGPGSHPQSTGTPARPRTPGPARVGPPGAPQRPASVLQGDALTGISPPQALPCREGANPSQPSDRNPPSHSRHCLLLDSSGAGPGLNPRLCPLSSVASLWCIATTVTK